MFNKYLSSIRHTAAQFTVGMSGTDAELLCLQFNIGRDPAKACVYNDYNSLIYIKRGSGTFPLVAEPGNWIVRMPDDSFEVHADADFCSKFRPAT